MNKGKLRSLMFHAGFCNEDGGWDNRPLFEQEHDNFQRFAELIVMECIDCARGAGLANDVAVRNGLGFNDGISEAVTHMKKHFGVEK